MVQHYTSKYFCLFPLRSREKCLIFEEKTWRTLNVEGNSLPCRLAGSFDSSVASAFISRLNMRERVVFVLLSCLVIPAHTKVLFERGLRTPRLTVPRHCLSCQTTRGSKHSFLGRISRALTVHKYAGCCTDSCSGC